MRLNAETQRKRRVRRGENIVNVKLLTLFCNALDRMEEIKSAFYLCVKKTAHTSTFQVTDFNNSKPTYYA